MIKKHKIMICLFALYGWIGMSSGYAEPPATPGDKAARFEKMKTTQIAILEGQLSCLRRAAQPSDIKQCHEQTKRVRVETRLNHLSEQRQMLDQREKRLKGNLEQKPAETP